MLAVSNALGVGHDLLQRMSEARRRSDGLLPDQSLRFVYDRPIPERHRIIFSHLEAFDWNLLRERIFDLKSPHPELDRLFAFGRTLVGGGLPADQPFYWLCRRVCATT